MSVEAELPERVYWHRGCYQYKSTELDRASGMKSWVRLGSTISETIANYHSLNRVTPEPPKSLGWLLRWYLSEIAVQLRERTLEDKRRHVLRITERIGNLDVDAVRPADIQRYVFAKGKESPNQAKQELSTMPTAASMQAGFKNPLGTIPLPTVYEPVSVTSPSQSFKISWMTSSWWMSLRFLKRHAPSPFRADWLRNPQAQSHLPQLVDTDKNLKSNALWR